MNNGHQNKTKLIIDALLYIDYQNNMTIFGDLDLLEINAGACWDSWKYFMLKQL